MMVGSFVIKFEYLIVLKVRVFLWVNFFFCVYIEFYQVYMRNFVYFLQYKLGLVFVSFFNYLLKLFGNFLYFDD